MKAVLSQLNCTSSSSSENYGSICGLSRSLFYHIISSVVWISRGDAANPNVSGTCCRSFLGNYLSFPQNFSFGMISNSSCARRNWLYTIVHGKNVLNVLCKATTPRSILKWDKSPVYLGVRPSKLIPIPNE